jgi:hypothetical protein
MKITALIYALSLFIVLYITGHGLKLLNTELLIRSVKQNGINYDAFRSFEVTEQMLKTSKQRMDHVLKQNSVLDRKMYMDSIGYLTFCIMASDYRSEDFGKFDEAIFLRGIPKIAGTPGFQELYKYYLAILTDITYFPVPRVEADYKDITYTDTWYGLRKYGGNRRHEGTDLMDPNNIRGFFPIISMTDGVVENMGWLDKGGYRIGIRGKSGAYFYYAHLNSYAPGLKAGDEVIAGQLLGFMGDSGYGPEGTVGMFDVHLHMGIYVSTDSGEMSVNPYWVLKMLEDNRTSYTFE